MAAVPFGKAGGLPVTLGGTAALARFVPDIMALLAPGLPAFFLRDFEYAARPQ